MLVFPINSFMLLISILIIFTTLIEAQTITRIRTIQTTRTLTRSTVVTLAPVIVISTKLSTRTIAITVASVSTKFVTITPSAVTKLITVTSPPRTISITRSVTVTNLVTTVVSTVISRVSTIILSLQTATDTFTVGVPVVSTLTLPASVSTFTPSVTTSYVTVTPLTSVATTRISTTLSVSTLTVSVCPTSSSSSSSSSISTSSSLTTSSGPLCAATGYSGTTVDFINFNAVGQTGAASCYTYCQNTLQCVSFGVTGTAPYITCYTFKSAAKNNYDPTRSGFVMYDMSCPASYFVAPPPTTTSKPAESSTTMTTQSTTSTTTSLLSMTTISSSTSSAAFGFSTDVAVDGWAGGFSASAPFAFQNNAAKAKRATPIGSKDVTGYTAANALKSCKAACDDSQMRGSNCGSLVLWFITNVPAECDWFSGSSDVTNLGPPVIANPQSVGYAQGYNRPIGSSRSFNLLYVTSDPNYNNWYLGPNGIYSFKSTYTLDSTGVLRFVSVGQTYSVCTATYADYFDTILSCSATSAGSLGQWTFDEFGTAIWTRTDIVAAPAIRVSNGVYIRHYSNSGRTYPTVGWNGDAGQCSECTVEGQLVRVMIVDDTLPVDTTSTPLAVTSTVKKTSRTDPPSTLTTSLPTSTATTSSTPTSSTTTAATTTNAIPPAGFTAAVGTDNWGGSVYAYAPFPYSWATSSEQKRADALVPFKGTLFVTSFVSSTDVLQKCKADCDTLQMQGTTCQSVVVWISVGTRALECDLYANVVTAANLGAPKLYSPGSFSAMFAYSRTTGDSRWFQLKYINPDPAYSTYYSGINSFYPDQRATYFQGSDGALYFREGTITLALCTDNAAGEDMIDLMESCVNANYNLYGTWAFDSNNQAILTRTGVNSDPSTRVSNGFQLKTYNSYSPPRVYPWVSWSGQSACATCNTLGQLVRIMVADPDPSTPIVDPSLPIKPADPTTLDPPNASYTPGLVINGDFETDELDPWTVDQTAGGDSSGQVVQDGNTGNGFFLAEIRSTDTQVTVSQDLGYQLRQLWTISYDCFFPISRPETTVSVVVNGVVLNEIWGDDAADRGWFTIFIDYDHEKDGDIQLDLVISSEDTIPSADDPLDVFLDNIGFFAGGQKRR